MKNNNITISLMIVLISITTLFIPLSLFYIVGFITILAICYLIYLQAKDQVKSGMSFWQLIILTVTFLVAIMSDGKIALCFYYISLCLLIWFVLYNVIVGYYIVQKKIDEKFSMSEEQIESIWLSVKNKEQSNVVLYNEQVKRLIEERINLSKVEIYNNMDSQFDSIKNEYQNNIDVESLEKELKSHINSIMNSYAKQDVKRLNSLVGNISAEKSDYKKFKEEMNKNLDDFRENHIASVKKSVNEMQGVVKQLRELSATNLEIIKNEKIRLKFEEAFKVAENEIDIVSPWINNHVMNNTGVYDYIKNSINKGVKIRIVYGIGRSENSYRDYSNSRNSRNIGSDEIAQRLEKNFRTYGDTFKIKRGDTHSKILICDNKFAIIGSFNFLSFDGNYKEDVREELAVVTTDQATINKLRNQEFDF
ncbi:phospholipase D-like domain-containing protein [Clostridium sp.]|uniref:phospholipase D-like domain-containing protein n=1 Tax=Clostridium sp. TaxID=1506 RepID=UPI002845E917|nr:phospholipase D-like domain-containing protein [Clostridium sp.]MDR3596797.1 phospholipase D-like domain-containing protein [Clostridium sp.]